MNLPVRNQFGTVGYWYQVPIYYQNIQKQTRLKHNIYLFNNYNTNKNNQFLNPDKLTITEL